MMTVFDFLSGVQFKVDTIDVNDSISNKTETFVGNDEEPNCVNRCINKYGPRLVSEWKVSDGPNKTTILEMTI